MKTQFVRMWAAGAAATSLIFCVGCEENKAGAQVPVVTPAAIAKGSTNAPLPAPNPVPDADPAPATAQVIQRARPPESVKVSPALADIIKLTQAGLSDDVLLAYITNSSRVFEVGSEEILYLNDLGLSSAVLTALIQNDKSSEMLALKKSSANVNALPAGLSLTVPAADIYPAAAVVGTQNVTDPAPPTYVAQPPPYQAEPQVEYVTQPVTITQPSVAYFYDSLSPYGNWVNVEGYGSCWQPTVAVVNSYWRPYGDRGRWLWSDHGWYWYSDYSWGWAPFHYGRWHSSQSLGWFWIPDTTWGPAWVTWRQTSTHCGWAPLPPGAVYNSGVGFSFHGSSVGVGFGFGLGLGAYPFVPFSRFCERNVSQHFVAPAHAATLYKDSSIVNNYTIGKHNTPFHHGVGVQRVAKATGNDLHQIVIREAPAGGVKPARHERLEGAGSSAIVYRPQLSKDSPRPAVHASTRPQSRPLPPTAPGTKLSATVSANPPAPHQPASPFVEVTRTPNSLTIARRPVPTVYPSTPAAPPPIDNSFEPRRTVLRPKAGNPSYPAPAATIPSPNMTVPRPMQPLGAAPPLAAPQPLSAPQPLAAPQPVRPAKPSPSSVRAELPRSYPVPAPAVQPAPSFSRPGPVIRESVTVPVPRPSYEAAPRSLAPNARSERVRPQPAAPAPSYSAPAPAAPAPRTQAPAVSNPGGGSGNAKGGPNKDKNP